MGAGPGGRGFAAAAVRQVSLLVQRFVSRQAVRTGLAHLKKKKKKRKKKLPKV